MKNSIALIALLCAVVTLTAQEVQTEKLTEVVVMPVNYKYLDQVDNKTAAVPVKQLEREAASYDLLSKDFYQDDYAHYTVSFYIPDGKLVAVYNHKGEIVRTIEKFSNIDIPTPLVETLKKEYPRWEAVSDVYKVTYQQGEGATKSYKIKLQKGDKIKRIKMSEAGQIQ